MPTFQYLKPTDIQIDTMQIFRNKYQVLYEDIITKNQGYTSRALSLALTKLEESAMWLNKAITHNE